jgi:hypothetical protein
MNNFDLKEINQLPNVKESIRLGQVRIKILELSRSNESHVRRVPGQVSVANCIDVKLQVEVTLSS